MIKIGDLAPMTSATVKLEKSSLQLKATNSRCGDRLMFLYLGQDSPRLGESIDPVQVLRHLGYTPTFEAESRQRRYLRAINWAVGCHGEFRPPAQAPKYWWRHELVERAGLLYDGERGLYVEES